MWLFNRYHFLGAFSFTSSQWVVDAEALIACHQILLTFKATNKYLFSFQNETQMLS